LTVKTAPMVVAASLALAMGVLVAPGSALAQRAQGFHDSGPVAGGTTLGVSRSVAVPLPQSFGGGPVVGGATLGVSRAVAVPFPPQRFVPRPFVRPSFPFAVVAGAPAVVYAAPPYGSAYYPPAYYDPAVSYGAPMSYSPPVSGAVSLAADPTQNVVQFPTGRYELRGDGVSTPFTWAWIPNPPTSPPPAALTALPAAPAASPVREPGSGRSQSPARVGHLYRWIDEQDVVHWTDRLDAVPEQYRSRVKQTSPS
jgi:hypothetical protein